MFLKSESINFSISNIFNRRMNQNMAELVYSEQIKVSSIAGSNEIANSFLLSSDTMSEGSIAIVKRFDFDFFIIHHCHSLIHGCARMAHCVTAR